MTALLSVALHITNTYAEDDEVERRITVDLPVPDSLAPDDVEQWGQEYLFPLTGDGRAQSEDGRTPEAYYEVVITDCSQAELVDRVFEWIG